MQTTTSPRIGQADHIVPHVRRILAPNPSPMTLYGTNTFLVGDKSVAVIDPGPASASHEQAILQALEPQQKITHIFVTHAHVDHSPLARRLSQVTGAPVLAFGNAAAGRSPVMQQLAASGLAGGGEGVDADFVPDQSLADGDIIATEDWSLEAIWTPGHFGNHMCFALGDVLFCGDLVMGWASSLVSPPDGDLTDFMTSCRKLQSRRDRIFLPGHGDPIEDPAARLNWLLSHRLSREAAILQHLSNGDATAESLARAIYTDTPQALLPAATRNVLAHLIDLTGKKIITPQGPLASTSIFHLENPHSKVS